MENTGGISPVPCSVARRLGRRASAKGAIDRTKYGHSRVSTKSFYTHHGQMLVKAAVVYDALAINKQIIGQRQKLCHDAGVAHAAGPGEESA